MKQNFPDNALYEMDNLEVLRGMNSETVDLIATDPPFNTKRSRAGTAGFHVDNWKWGDFVLRRRLQLCIQPRLCPVCGCDD